MPLDDRISGINNRSKPIDRLDDVVGGENAHRRFRIVPGKNRGAQANRVERIAPARFADELPGPNCGNARPIASACDCPAQTKRRCGGSSPASRSTAISNRLRPWMKGINCFGSAVRLIGQSRVPDPPAIITAYRIFIPRMGERGVWNRCQRPNQLIRMTGAEQPGYDYNGSLLRSHKRLSMRNRRAKKRQPPAGRPAALASHSLYRTHYGNNAQAPTHAVLSKNRPRTLSGSGSNRYGAQLPG